jgi:hypothetical protein
MHFIDLGQEKSRASARASARACARPFLISFDKN